MSLEEVLFWAGFSCVLLWMLAVTIILSFGD